MSKLTGKKLIDLGFVKNFVTAEESGDKPYAYYVLETSDLYGMCLISDSLDEGESDEKEIKISIFNYNDIGVCETDDELRILWKALTRKEL